MVLAVSCAGAGHQTMPVVGVVPCRGYSCPDPTAGLHPALMGSGRRRRIQGRGHRESAARRATAADVQRWG